MTSRFRKLIFAFTALILIAPAADAASPRVDISPTRLVIEARERSAELTIVNAFSDLGTYRVQLISNRMKPEGGYTRLDDVPLDAAYDPKEYVRVTPRQFSLETRGVQRVRLSVRRPEGLPDGDYRFHVLLVRLADAASVQTLKQGEREILIGSNIGVSIPVIVRQGAYDGDIEIENAEILGTAETPVIKMRLKRISSAPRDIFGLVQIYWEPPGGQRELIGTLNNLNVFHEIEFRDSTVRLKKYPQGGKVIIQYIEDHYKQGLLDEVVINR
jgi:hypothetical protein